MNILEIIGSHKLILYISSRYVNISVAFEFDLNMLNKFK